METIKKGVWFVCYDPNEYNEVDLFIAQNPITLLTTAWYPTVEDLIDGADEDGLDTDDIIISAVGDLDFHNVIINGEQYSKQYALKHYPEYFV